MQKIGRRKDLGGEERWAGHSNGEDVVVKNLAKGWKGGDEKAPGVGESKLSKVE